MRAAPENHGALFQPEASQNRGRYLRVNFYVLGIVFDAAHVTNFLLFSADCFPSLNVFEILDTNRVQESKSRRDKTAKHPKPFLGPRRQSSVDQSDRYFPGVCFGQEIGPDFRFN